MQFSFLVSGTDLKKSATIIKIHEKMYYSDVSQDARCIADTTNCVMNE